MYRRIDVATKDVADIAKRIGYRKKKASIVVSERVSLNGLNWSGGSRSQYTAIHLGSGGMSNPDFSKPPPWSNPNEGMEIEIPDGVAIVQHGTFMGKPGLMTIYVNPNTMARLLPAPEAS